MARRRKSRRMRSRQRPAPFQRRSLTMNKIGGLRL